MKTMFSQQQENSSQVSYQGKTVIGVVFSVVISGALVLGLTEQTGSNPAHWATPKAVATEVAANPNAVRCVADCKMTVVAKNQTRAAAAQPAPSVQLAQTAGDKAGAR